MNTLRSIAADGAISNRLPIMEDAVNIWIGQTRDRAQQERRFQALNSEIASEVGQFWDDTRAFIREGLPEYDSPSPWGKAH